MMKQSPSIRDAGKKLNENQTLARAVAILQAFSHDTPDLGVRQLSRILKLNKSTVHRLAQSLAHHGFLEQDSTTMRYRIGLNAFEIGSRYVSASGLEEAAMPVLQRLSREHQLNAYLGVLRERSAIYLIALQSTGPIVIRIDPGSRQHLHSTALGKALLAGQPNWRIEAILGPGPLPKLTPATLESPADVILQLEEVRRQGYAVSYEENRPGVLAIGAPVADWSGRTLAAIGIACPSYLTPDDRILPLARLVVEAADQVSKALAAKRTVGNASTGTVQEQP
ncbi:MAG: IclR family transcriptional regulator [Gemmatimonadetes bacterium]|nr:IclR family transcriptional regulator [Gemmatimonadota bacterium]